VNGRRVEGHPGLGPGGPSQRKPARKKAFGRSFSPAFFVFPGAVAGKSKDADTGSAANTKRTNDD
jgi:hypothetical protein